MRVVITEWALDSYLDLKHSAVIVRDDYTNIIRPDVELLRDSFPTHPKFGISKFWGPATDKGGKRIDDGYKMKWHNFGPQQLQLRLAVGIVDGVVYLCQGYVKTGDPVDKRECQKLKARIQLIRQKQHVCRGEL